MPNVKASAKPFPPIRFLPWMPPVDFACCEESGNRFALLEALGFFVDLKAAHCVMDSHADACGPERRLLNRESAALRFVRSNLSVSFFDRFYQTLCWNV